MKKINKNFWFTLIEIMLGILIFSLIIVWGFQAFASLNIWKVKLMQRVNTEKQNIYFIEKFFEEIKKWWLVDFEEYFNRKVVWTAFSSGHYDLPTWFWNFWEWWDPWVLPIDYWTWFYYCRSWDWLSMTNTWLNIDLWCFNNWNYNNTSNSQIWEPQRYWEYSFQFIDYNSNADIDLWDEDWINWIVWDDDDEFLWRWPIAFSWWTDLKELYLIWWSKTTRTLFRWNVKEDPNKPAAETCSINWSNIITWSWCLWTIQMLKLDWKDWWMDHEEWTPDPDKTESDWVIDTWVINWDFDPNFNWTNYIIAWSNTNNYWLDVFPDTINIIDFKVFLYPNIDSSLSWKESNSDVRLSPYVRINISMLPSWKTRRWLKWNPSPMSFSTTISLTDIFSK